MLLAGAAPLMQRCSCCTVDATKQDVDACWLMQHETVKLKLDLIASPHSELHTATHVVLAAPILVKLTCTQCTQKFTEVVFKRH